MSSILRLYLQHVDWRQVSQKNGEGYRQAQLMSQKRDMKQLQEKEKKCVYFTGNKFMMSGRH